MVDPAIFSLQYGWKYIRSNNTNNRDNDNNNNNHTSTNDFNYDSSVLVTGWTVCDSDWISKCNLNFPN